MRLLSKSLIVLLLVFLVFISTLFMINPISAQSIPKPSVPEFSLKIVTRPYDVQPTTTIDPYTGKTIITQGGYHVENKSIDVIIKNQPFKSYFINGSEVVFWYYVQFKGHYSTNWQIYRTDSSANIAQSDGDFTVISVPVNNNQKDNGINTTFPEGEVDFQVQALIGSFIYINQPFYFDKIEFVGEESDWSATQTIRLRDNSVPATSNPITPTTTPYVPTIPPSVNSNGSTQITIELSFTNLLLVGGIAVAVVLAVVLSIVLLVRHRKTLS